MIACWRLFYGRLAINVDFMRSIGDKVPGSSGAAVEEKMFGRTGEPRESSRSFRRLPVVAIKLPVNVWRAKRNVESLKVDADRWWREAVAPDSTATVADAKALFQEALGYWYAAARAHMVLTLMAVGCYEQLQGICRRAGSAGLELRLLSSDKKILEAQTVSDLWAVAHGQASLQTFLVAHGYHGPAEGQLSSRSWREDPSPLEPLLEAYAEARSQRTSG